MQTIMAGLLQFPRGIICKNEVLGRTYKTTIGGGVVGVQMPVAANKEDKNGVLKSSTPGFEFNIDWGYGIRVPDKTSLIKAATIISKGAEECAVSIYKSFPDWLDRFRTIIRMYPYDLYKEPICQPLQRGEEGVDKFSGITLYRLL